jgi:hypothetical protein
MKRTLAALSFAFLVVALPAAAKTSGAAMPDEVTLGDCSAQLNGSAVQKFAMMKLYSIGMYLAERTDDPQEAITCDQPKQIRLRALRNLPAGSVAKALRDGFARTAEGRHPSAKPGLEKMLKALTDVEKGQEITFTYLPGEGMTVSADGRSSTVIKSKAFADAIFSIWLSPQTDAPGIRTALLGR